MPIGCSARSCTEPGSRGIVAKKVRSLHARPDLVTVARGAGWRKSWRRMSRRGDQSRYHLATPLWPPTLGLSRRLRGAVLGGNSSAEANGVTVTAGRPGPADADRVAGSQSDDPPGSREDGDTKAQGSKPDEPPLLANARLSSGECVVEVKVTVSKGRRREPAEVIDRRASGHGVGITCGANGRCLLLLAPTLARLRVAVVAGRGP